MTAWRWVTVAQVAFALLAVAACLVAAVDPKWAQHRREVQLVLLSLEVHGDL